MSRVSFKAQNLSRMVFRFYRYSQEKNAAWLQGSIDVLEWWKDVGNMLDHILARDHVEIFLGKRQGFGDVVREKMVAAAFLEESLTRGDSVGRDVTAIDVVMPLLEKVEEVPVRATDIEHPPRWHIFRYAIDLALPEQATAQKVVPAR